MLMPNTVPNIRKKMLLALTVAVRAASPSTWLTQMALAEPFSDCRMFEPITGRANRIRVLAIGPVVRSCIPEGPPAAAFAFKLTIAPQAR